ncbi:hypothetical protein [Streptomyces sp. NPDC058812]|uniref:hypothetical protein n=1 Tax=unclassified Streptomyces TaxID=2593676 RepID=UPI0036BD088C
MPRSTDELTEQIQGLHADLDRGAWTPSPAERVFAGRVADSLAASRPLHEAILDGLRGTGHDLASGEAAPFADGAISCAKFFRSPMEATSSEGGQRLYQAFLLLLRSILDDPHSGVGAYYVR